MTGLGRGCVKTRLRSVFGSIKTPPHHKQIEYSAFYEVVFDDTSFRAEFLHGLDQKQTSVHHFRSRVRVHQNKSARKLRGPSREQATVNARGGVALTRGRIGRGRSA